MKVNVFLNYERSQLYHPERHCLKVAFLPCFIYANHNKQNRVNMNSSKVEIRYFLCLARSKVISWYIFANDESLLKTKLFAVDRFLESENLR